MIQKESWFEETIFYKDLKIDLQAIKDACLNLQKTSNGRKISNIGGWQSNNVHNEPFIKPILKEMKDLIELYTRHYGVKSQFELTEIESWVNINESNDFNLAHIHPHIFASAVFYVESKDQEATIDFMGPGHLIREYVYSPEYVDFKPSNYGAVVYPPIEGRVLMFPGYLEHCVMPTKDTRRISIAINFGLKEKYDI